MIGIIIQARLGSKRLPNKVMKTIRGRILFDVMIKRVKKSKIIDKLIVATSKNEINKKIIRYCQKNKIDYFIGSEKDVMSRYVKAAKKYNIGTIIRLTADCPLIDPTDIDKLYKIYLNNYDYVSNTCPNHLSYFPDGSDIEIFELKTLEKINQEEKRKKFREHVTLNYYNKKIYKTYILKDKKNNSNIRYTLDYKEDFKVLQNIFNFFENKIEDVSRNEIVKYLNNNKNVYLINDSCKIQAKKWKK